MSAAEGMFREYQAGGIWTMSSPRNSCVVPERPLILNTKEQWELPYIAKMVWSGLGSLTNADRRAKAQWPEFIRIRDTGTEGPFPEGTTLPPAIRMDIVRTLDGPKIVEVDPISAISLGEVAFLANVWQAHGFEVIQGPTARVVSGVMTSGANRITITLPRRLSSQMPEQRYLAHELEEASYGNIAAEVRLGTPGESELELSAFIEDAQTRTKIEQDGFPGARNPLWGSMMNLASKRNLEMLREFGLKELCENYLPKQFSKEQRARLDSDTLVVCKPLEGTGSQGIAALAVAQALTLEGEWIYQELLSPVVDDFGRCLSADHQVIESGKWITRLSIYASETGLSGAQATARLYEGEFTNVHGQRDAIQSAVAAE